MKNLIGRMLYTAVAGLGFVFVAGILPPQLAFGSEKVVGAIVSTTSASKNASDTAVVFYTTKMQPNPGQKWCVQCDVDTYVRFDCSGASCTASATNATKLDAGQNYCDRHGPGEDNIATLGVAVTSTCLVKRQNP